MALTPEFLELAALVRNWGRWGDDDEIGTLNLITPEKVQQAAGLVRHGKVFPLGVDFGSSGPQGAFHCGIDKVDVKGITSRGVLLDLVRHRGAQTFLEHGEPILPDELDEVARAQGVSVGSGDVVLIRTGWWDRFLEAGNGTEPYSGLDWRCASWLHEREVAAVAADNLMVEDPKSGIDGTILPLHMLCLRDMGMMLGEYWDLGALAADCAADGVYEFQLIAPPLRVTGAVGSPVNPIAIK